MQAIGNRWEAVRSSGLILVSFPEQGWSRTCHEWNAGVMRAYLRNARHIPAQDRLEVLAWLEQQEASVESEIAAADKRHGDRAEFVFWCVFALAAAVVVGSMVVAMGG
jgi:hypothetical protein